VEVLHGVAARATATPEALGLGEERDRRTTAQGARARTTDKYATDGRDAERRPVMAETMARSWTETINPGVKPALELSAHMTVRPGQLAGFKAQAAEIMRLVREQDTQTLRYDWFLSDDGTECEVREAYPSEEGLFEHVVHIRAARDTLFRDFADDHLMTVYGTPSQQFIELAKAHGAAVRWFTLLQGLEPSPTMLPGFESAKPMTADAGEG
jgi:hypothetical protein